MNTRLFCVCPIIADKSTNKKISNRLRKNENTLFYDFYIEITKNYVYFYQSSINFAANISH